MPRQSGRVVGVVYAWCGFGFVLMLLALVRGEERFQAAAAVFAGLGYAAFGVLLLVNVNDLGRRMAAQWGPVSGSRVLGPVVRTLSCAAFFVGGLFFAAVGALSLAGLRPL